jgi:hypothetical protein
MDVGAFIRDQWNDDVEIQSKHAFWRDLTEALYSVYLFKTKYRILDFLQNYQFECEPVFKSEI